MAAVGLMSTVNQMVEAAARLPSWVAVIALMVSLLTGLVAAAVRVVGRVWPQDSADRKELLKALLVERSPTDDGQPEVRQQQEQPDETGSDMPP